MEKLEKRTMFKHEESTTFTLKKKRSETILNDKEIPKHEAED